MISFDVAVAGIMETCGVDRDRAVAMARRSRDVAPDAVALAPIDVAALEKQVEHEGDQLMQKLGFEVIRFSRPGKTKQTPGIPDRRYYRRPRVVSQETRPDGLVLRHTTKPIVVWVEYKSATGEQRPGQKLFQELCTECGEAYVLGGLAELQTWLVERGIAEAV